MGNIFKVFLSLSALTVLSSCDVFLTKNDDGFECESNLEKVYEKTSLNNFEQTKFKDLLANRFPKYREMFEQASTKTTIDSDLLAAISFQESQWDPKAKSNMGVSWNSSSPRARTRRSSPLWRLNGDHAADFFTHCFFNAHV